MLNDYSHISKIIFGLSILCLLASIIYIIYEYTNNKDFYNIKDPNVLYFQSVPIEQDMNKYI